VKSSRLAAFVGLEPSEGAPSARLGTLIALATFAEFLAEGVVTSVFLAKIGAAFLPSVLALRALSEIALAVAFVRLADKQSPRTSMAWVVGLGVVSFTACAALLGAELGVYAAFILAAVVVRLRVIHFGVLALAELGSAAPRALPLVYACARFGAMAAGATLTAFSARMSPTFLLLGAAVVYGVSLLALRHLAEGVSRPAVSPLADDDAPPSGGLRYSASERGRDLLIAIGVGAAALAMGRIALHTQSGAILEATFSQEELQRVLGAYFTAANALALLLQVSVVGRILARGGLPWLNLGWAALYVVAQLALVLSPPVVLLALGARLVESELRQGLRTPVSNLLYDALPSERRARARTFIIGIVIPLASLAAGLSLSMLSPQAVAAFGVCAALLLLGASWAQNRALSRALSEPRPIK
jgi:hypothetical protein